MFYRSSFKKLSSHLILSVTILLFKDAATTSDENPVEIQAIPTHDECQKDSQAIEPSKPVAATMPEESLGRRDSEKDFEWDFPASNRKSRADMPIKRSSDFVIPEPKQVS